MYKKFLLSIDTPLMNRLREESEREGISISAMVRWALKTHFRRMDFEKSPEYMELLYQYHKEERDD